MSTKALSKSMSISKKFRLFFSEDAPFGSKSLKPILRSRWVRAVLYILICMNALLYSAWAIFSELLLYNGLYSWYCGPNDPLFIKFKNLNVCEKQLSAVQPLFNLAQSAEFGFSILAGLSIDYLGPLITSFIGSLMAILALIGLISSSEAFSVAPVAMVMLGGSVNMLAFPCLELEFLFPKCKQAAVSIIISAQLAGPLVIMALLGIIKSTSWTPKNVLLGYVFFVTIPLFVASILIHPAQRLCNLKGNREKLLADIHESSLSIKTDDMREETEAVELAKDNKYVKIEKNGDYISNTVTFKQLITHLQSKLIEFLKSLVQVKYGLFLIFTLVYMILVTAHGYYENMLSFMFNDEVAEFQSRIMPSQGPVGILLGFVADIIGALWSIQLINALFLLTVLASFSSMIGAWYTSAILFTVANSYIYTTKYAYIVEFYAKKDLGKLVGLIGTATGLFNLINLQLGRFKTPSDVMTFIGLVVCTCMGVMALLQHWHNTFSINSSKNELEVDNESQIQNPL